MGEYTNHYFLCGDMYNCKMCRFSVEKSELQNLISHIETKHVNETALVNKDQKCLPYHRPCKSQADVHAHYICPICEKSVCSKVQFIMHVMSHGAQVSLASSDDQEKSQNSI